MPGSPFLVGDRVTLSTVEEDDLPFLREGNNDPRVRVPASEPLPSNLYQERAWFEETSVASDRIQLLVVHDDARVGVVELDPIDRATGAAEVAYWMSPEHRERGFAREALELLVEYAFSELRLHRVYAGVYDFNEGSKRVLERTGFTAEGVLREDAFVDGAYHDTHYYGLLAHEWRERQNDGREQTELPVVDREE